jgi:protein gp37
MAMLEPLISELKGKFRFIATKLRFGILSSEEITALDWIISGGREGGYNEREVKLYRSPQIR